MDQWEARKGTWTNGKIGIGKWTNQKAVLPISADSCHRTNLSKGSPWLRSGLLMMYMGRFTGIYTTCHVGTHKS